MGQKNDQPTAQLPNFQPWYGEDGNLPPNEYGIGRFFCDTTEVAWHIELWVCTSAEEEVPYAELICGYPRAVRVSYDSGVLHEYWNGGIVVQDHNLLVATRSDFLDWLGRSSGGLYGVGVDSLEKDTKHYAIITDDLCVEILTAGTPEIRLQRPDGRSSSGMTAATLPARLLGAYGRLRRWMAR